MTTTVSPIGLEVDVHGDGTTVGIVTSYNDRGATVEARTPVGVEIHAVNTYTGLYARVAALTVVENAGCSCGMADVGAPGHDGHALMEAAREAGKLEIVSVSW